jgi:HK97 family phage major capsid protein
MSTLAAINEAIEGQNRAFNEFKKTNDERIEALSVGNTSRAKELDAKLERIEKDIKAATEIKRVAETEMQLMRERIEELESRQRTPGKSPEQKMKDEHKESFISWIRQRGHAPAQEQKMQELERKGVTIGSSAGGGYAVPEEISREIERMELLFSPVRSLVKVVKSGTSDYKELIDLTGATSGWVGESGSRTATATPSLREVVPTNGEIYAYPQASEWSLDDMLFNVEQWLAESVAESFALEEGDAVIRGNGSSQPTGMLNTTPVSTDDFASPLRAAAAYQYVDCDTDDEGSPAVPGLLSDRLIDLVYKLRAPYRMGATFVMNSLTAAGVRKLKDANGQYHWQPGLQAGQPDRLLGFPLAIWEQMDDIGATKFPVAFGNFRRGYTLVDRTTLRVTRDNITSIGFVKFYIRRREGGIVTNNDAIKFLRTIQ